MSHDDVVRYRLVGLLGVQSRHTQDCIQPATGVLLGELHWQGLATCDASQNTYRQHEQTTKSPCGGRPQGIELATQITDTRKILLSRLSCSLESRLQPGDVCQMIGLMTLSVSQALLVHGRLANQSISPFADFSSPTNCMVTGVEHFKFEHGLSLAR